MLRNITSVTTIRGGLVVEIVYMTVVVSTDLSDKQETTYTGMGLGVTPGSLGGVMVSILA